MRPSLDKWYPIGDLHLYNVITTTIKESRVSFSKEDLSDLQLVNKDYVTIVPKVILWLRINFTPLREPRLGYENQECILVWIRENSYVSHQKSILANIKMFDVLWMQ